MRIIGGEFEIPLGLGTEKFAIGGGIADRYYYATGRSALCAILRSVSDAGGSGRKVLVPDYICASVTKTISDTGYGVSFYKIDDDFLPMVESLCSGLQKDTILFLVNYFGMLSLEKTISFVRQRQEEAVIIIDDVQNYYGFGRTSGSDYAFTSFRKWFPVPDGAEVIVKNRKQGRKPDGFKDANEFAQYKFAGNILKNFRGKVGDALYLDLIEKGERILEDGYKCKCSDYSLEMMDRIDKTDFAEKRKRNAWMLHEGLDRLGIPHAYNRNTVPLFVPVFLENRAKVRAELAEHNIFCPVHWPRVSGNLQGNNHLYDIELSLVCDQRYDEDDMGRILEVLEYACKNI